MYRTATRFGLIVTIAVVAAVKNGGTSGFGTVIAINPTKDAAIFIGMNQVGASPAMKGIEILRQLP